MITSKDCLKRYGDPTFEKAMVVFDVPSQIEIGFIPKKVYCNKDLVKPLEKALTLVVSRGLAGTIKSWDGCFNIRKKRGLTSMSLHSWGLAVDINAAWNRLGQPSTMDKRLVDCFVEAGFEWGGNWTRKDCMHFELKSFNSNS